MNGHLARVIHVVDGDPAVRDSLTTLLGLNGFEVEAYATGGAYLDRRRRQQDTDAVCVVCEAELPDGSGIDLYASMRAADANTPFILLVSRRDPGIVRSARNAGIDQVLQKPLVYRNLLSRITGQQH